MLHRLSPQRIQVVKCLPDRIARQYNLFLREIFFHPLIGHAYLLGLLRQQLVGDSGIAVLLLYQSRDIHSLRLLQNRS